MKQDTDGKVALDLPRSPESAAGALQPRQSDTEDFEAAIKAQFPDELLVIGEDGYYLDERIQAAWWGWHCACAVARAAYAAINSAPAVVSDGVRVCEGDSAQSSEAKHGN